MLKHSLESGNLWIFEILKNITTKYSKMPAKLNNLRKKMSLTRNYDLAAHSDMNLNKSNIFFYL